MKTRSKTYHDDIPTPPLDLHFTKKKKITAAEIIDDVVSKLNEESQLDANKSPIDDDPGGTLQVQSEPNLMNLETTTTSVVESNESNSDPNPTAEVLNKDIKVDNDVTASNVGTNNSNIVLADSKSDAKLLESITTDK